MSGEGPINSETLAQVARSGGLLAALVIVAQYTGVSAMAGPFSATCALLAILPKASFSQPKVIFFSHLICIAAGAALVRLPLPPLVIAFAAAWISIMGMALCRVVHAPAVAHAVILALGKQDVILYSAIAMMTATAFAVYALVTLSMRRTPHAAL